MQFYLNGYRFGDPDLLPAASGAMVSGEALPDEVDVLIVGCGPAGLVLGAQLAAFPDIKTRIVDRRPGPLQLGQADGIACRGSAAEEGAPGTDRLRKNVLPPR
jgi:phenol 2-monooxygenase